MRTAGKIDHTAILAGLLVSYRELTMSMKQPFRNKLSTDSDCWDPETI